MATPAPNFKVVAKEPKRVIVAFKVNFELNTTNGLRRVIFGLEKKPGTATGVTHWEIHFTLFERAKRTDPFGDAIVKLDVEVDTELSTQAELMAQNKPTPEQSAEIVGPVAEDAKALKANELSKEEFDQSAQGVLH